MKKLKNNLKWHNFLKTYLIEFVRYYAHLRLSCNCPFPQYIFSENIQFNEKYAVEKMAYYNTKYPLLCKQIERLLNNHYKKKKRVKLHLEEFLNSSELVFFGTLTFTDNVLNNTCWETRRKYVRRFLKDNSIDYLANRDFGDKTHREHYHTAFISFDKEFFQNWKYGFVNVKQVVNAEDCARLSEYITKLANHSVKATADRVIYSRGSKLCKF